MSEKNLDRLFQEKLKDFEEIPEEKVWDDISTSLDKKKSRKVIPFWWKLGGVAAVLAIIFMAVNPFGDNDQNTPVITNVETESPSERKGDETIQMENISKEANQIADTENKKAQTETQSAKNEETHSAETQIGSKKLDENDLNTIQGNETKLALSDVEKTIQKKEGKSSTEKNTVLDKNGVLNEAFAINTNAPDKSDPKNISLENERDEKLKIENSIEKSVASSAVEQKEKSIDESQKKSIFDEIKKQNEEDALTKNKSGNWSIGPNLAPVYFNSFGEGSPVDQSFNSNSKSGKINMSYGLSVAYGINNKLRIRTGIHKVDYSYGTNEVEFSPSLQGSLSSRLKNVDYTEASENIVVESKLDNQVSFAESKRSSDVLANNISRNGTMAQKFGYIEIPVELDYAIIDNRFGVNLIGGVSSMFLTNNSLALNSSNETIELGEANNLNSINFSTNIGFGLNYKFTPKIQLNVEPVFKYQLNTFSDVSGSFNPFSIGVYSGLNFRF